MQELHDKGSKSHCNCQGLRYIRVPKAGHKHTFNLRSLHLWHAFESFPRYGIESTSHSHILYVSWYHIGFEFTTKTPRRISCWQRSSKHAIGWATICAFPLPAYTSTLEFWPISSRLASHLCCGLSVNVEYSLRVELSRRIPFLGYVSTPFLLEGGISR